MYIPKHFEEPQTETMHALIRSHPLATLITLNVEGIEANHIPFVLLEEPQPFGLLQGHVARANPLWRNHPAESDVLALFHGPESYISPSWYATKAETGKVVPTWNYVSVHAKGRLRVIHDAIWLRSQLERLTAHNETALPQPWAVADAPEDYTEKLIEAIVGIEIVITDLKGKWKVSQNRPPRDQVTVIQGLRAHDQEEMAQIVESKSS